MKCCKKNPRHNLNNTGDNNTDVLEQEFRSNAKPAKHNCLESVLIIPDMHCAGCVYKIERSLNCLAQVKAARANLSLRRVSVIWDPNEGDGYQIKKSLNDLGFENYFPEQIENQNSESAIKSKQLLLSLGVAGFASANIMLLSISVWSGATGETAQLFHLLSGLIAIPAVAYAGRPFFNSALKALSVRHLNMDVPISLAILLSLGMSIFEALSGGSQSYFDAAVMLLFFLLIGRYLDHLMREKARSSVSSLAQMTCKGGLLINDDQSLQFIAQNEIVAGQKLRVLPGERFPVDGKIISGITDIDRSFVTGESASLSAKAGDQIEAGVLNLSGPVDVISTSDSNTSFVAEIMKMMMAAENGRSQYSRIADRAARIYAPAVHLGALITFLSWMFVSSGDWKTSLYVAISVLLITCPCALGLAVPIVHVVGANRLFNNGIFMRDGSALERLGEIDSVVFDKTGTLTNGKLTLEYHGNLSRDAVNMIGALSEHSNHPVSIAFQKKFPVTKHISIDKITELPGYGIEANIEGNTVRLGRASWVLEITRSNIENIEKYSAAFGKGDGRFYGFELSDELREGVFETVAYLHDADKQVSILSGDIAPKVKNLAMQLSISDFHSQMSPAKKVNYLKEMADRGQKVLMVGDGLNDAPALLAAHVSMAPANASEVGRLASDFIFTRSSLIAVPFAIQLSQQTKKLIRQNFAIAIAYNFIAIPFAVAGQVTPLFAALAMSFSSIVVVANSMRLNLWSMKAKQRNTVNYWRFTKNFIAHVINPAWSSK